MSVNFEEVWEGILIEYIEAYGITEKYEHYLRLKVAAMDMYNKAFNGGKMYLIPLADVNDKDADKLLKVESSTIWEQSAELSKTIGFRINPKDITVAEFMAFIKTASNGKNKA